MSTDKYYDAVLRDGRSLRVRPITPDDKERLRDLFYRLSPRARYFRFQYTKTDITDEELEHFTHMSPPANYAYVGTMRDTGEERIVAVGRWYQSTVPERAEIAFVVEDSIQFKGIGTVMLERLAEAAIKYRITTFLAAVLPENTRMLEVFQDSGFKTTRVWDEGVYGITINLEEREEYDRKSAYREHIARSSGVRSILYPKTIAIIGASRKPQTVGGAVFHNLLQADFTGILYPVNPQAPSIGGVLCYPSVNDIPGDIDLAVIVVPAKGVLDVLDQCAKKGVKGIVIISAGFGEAGPDGKALEHALTEKVVGYGMRLIGPNCLGFINLDPTSRINATFSPLQPPAGNLSIATQSGALGLALIDYTRSLDLGIAHFVSIGNRVDISSNDLLEFWEDDENTGIILLYEESFGNPRKFSRIARRVSRRKPIIAVKAGRSEVGAKAASSHTGALAASDVAVDAMFRQAGVIRVGTIEEMFNVARGMADQPLPKGNRVGILTNAGGPGVLTADACEGWRLDVPNLTDETQGKMREFLPKSAAVRNPVDMIASASPQDYSRCLTLMLDDPNIDSVVIIYIPPLVTQPEDVASALHDALVQYKGDKPVFACFMMLMKRIADLKIAPGCRVPMFTFPEDAVQALARAYQYYQYKNENIGNIVEFEDVTKETSERIIADSGCVNEQGGWLMPEQAAGLLRGYGISVPDVRAAFSSDEAAANAGAIGFPVAMKIRSSTIIHKTDVGGVVLNLATSDDVRRAYEGMAKNVSDKGRSAEMQGVIIQPMVNSEGGVELIAGMAFDPLFGPLVMIGLGGVLVELLKDVAFSLHPLRDIDPERMLNQLRGLPLLKGWRGQPAGDLEAVKDVLLRFSAMIEDFPEIEQVEINPLVVYPKGCTALDFRVRVRKPL